MKHCPKCNLDFPVTFRFCGACGGSLIKALTCQGCGDLVESKWTFCTNCGSKISTNETTGWTFSPNVPEQIKTLEPAAVQSSTRPSQTATSHPLETQSDDGSHREWYAAPDLFEATDETTVTPIRQQAPRVAIPAATQIQSGNGKAPPTLTMLSAYGESEITAQPEWRIRNTLLALLLLLIVGCALGFGGIYWWTHRTSGAPTPSSAEASAGSTKADVSSSSSAASATTTSSAATANFSADEEWKRLREKRIAAKPGEATDVINSLQEAEKKYPNDYRFPYERAKLSIKGITSHHDAFEALSAATEKAVDNGKALEMLDSLTADRDGDFYKLSHGHHEWQALSEALRNNDRAGLKTLLH